MNSYQDLIFKILRCVMCLYGLLIGFKEDLIFYEDHKTIILHSHLAVRMISYELDWYWSN